MSTGMQVSGVQRQLTEARTEQGGLPLRDKKQPEATLPQETGKSSFESILLSYRELAGRDAVPELAWVTGQEERLRWAATELEAVLLRDLLNTMLSPGKGSFWGNGPGAQVYSSLFLEEMARELARTGHFGVADTLVEQLGSQGEQTDATRAGRPVTSPSADRLR
ncbi:MAG: rod-binding protein [Limnochordales bacterium]|nr:rod-binding protein [Limnochordales bacterium]